MKYILKILISLTIFLSLLACCSEGNYRKYFDLKNNSVKSIYHGVSYSYPDISLKSMKKEETFIIPPRDVYQLAVASFLRNPTIQVFIFDADVIENTPWDTIVKYNMVLKHYQFTERELEKMNWEIIYDEK